MIVLAVFQVHLVVIQVVAIPAAMTPVVQAVIQVAGK